MYIFYVCFHRRNLFNCTNASGLSLKRSWHCRRKAGNLESVPLNGLGCCNLLWLVEAVAMWLIFLCQNCPALLAVHAAFEKVLYASGAAEHIAETWKDFDDKGVLASDGSCNIAAALVVSLSPQYKGRGASWEKLRTKWDRYISLYILPPKLLLQCCWWSTNHH